MKKKLESWGGWPKTFHFTFKRFRDGEWMCVCKEHNGVMTGGKGRISQKRLESMLQDLVLTVMDIGISFPKVK